jgi:hypothetical protein
MFGNIILFLTCSWRFLTNWKKLLGSRNIQEKNKKNLTVIIRFHLTVSAQRVYQSLDERSEYVVQGFFVFLVKFLRKPIKIKNI